MELAGRSRRKNAGPAELTALFTQYWGDRLTPAQVEALASAVGEAAGDRQARAALSARVAERAAKAREARPATARWFDAIVPRTGQAAAS